MATVRAEDHPGDPQEWFDRIAPQDGSWWPVWADWLRARSGAPVAPPPMGKELGDAPGSYVLMR